MLAQQDQQTIDNMNNSQVKFAGVVERVGTVHEGGGQIFSRRWWSQGLEIHHVQRVSATAQWWTATLFVCMQVFVISDSHEVVA